MQTSDIITAIGIPALGGGLIYIGRKLQILDHMQIDIRKIKNNLKVVTNYLIKSHSDFNAAELEPYSPLTLTDIGQKLITDIGFDRVFENNKAEFFECIESDEPKVKYDVETSAIKSISLLSNADFMQFLKVYVYNNPNRANNIAPTLGVYVRDKYLAEHPEITQ